MQPSKFQMIEEEDKIMLTTPLTGVNKYRSSFKSHGGNYKRKSALVVSRGSTMPTAEVQYGSDTVSNPNPVPTHGPSIDCSDY